MNCSPGPLQPKGSLLSGRYFLRLSLATTLGALSFLR